MMMKLYKILWRIFIPIKAPARFNGPRTFEAPSGALLYGSDNMNCRPLCFSKLAICLLSVLVTSWEFGCVNGETCPAMSCNPDGPQDTCGGVSCVCVPDETDPTKGSCRSASDQGAQELNTVSRIDHSAFEKNKKQARNVDPQNCVLCCAKRKGRDGKVETFRRTSTQRPLCNPKNKKNGRK
ncbi:hypothetical protein V5799_004419 [Amblyomma americanum]|uniref:Uncharacterized protein n=1 Tax=Amblyomma americanum TaxID=6943 RepID=A0AAQ4D659_AMBAM